MSRLFRGTRFLFPRLAPRAGNQQEVVFHNIKVKRGKYGYGGRLNRIFLFCGVTYLAVKTYDRLVLNPLYEAVKAAEESGALVVEEDEEEDEDVGLFIPIPLTTKKVTPKPYAATDPEWREFVKVSHDRELQNKMRSMLVAKVLRASQGSSFVSRFGKPTKASRTWLDLDFPLYPPPEFEQTGILINSEIIGIAVRERDALPAQLEQRVLWPKPIAMGLWATLVEATKQQKAWILKTIGYDTGEATAGPLGEAVQQIVGSSTAGGSDIRKSIQALREQATRRPGEVPSADSNRTSTTEGSALKPSLPIPAKPSVTSSDAAKDGKVVEPRKQAPSPFLGAFLQKYQQTYSPFRQYPPRGAIPVTGIVQVETTHTWVYVDVFAWYDPKTRDYDQDSLAMRVNRWRAKRKTPLR